MSLLKNWRRMAVVLFVLGMTAFAMWPEAVEVDAARAERGSMQVTIDEDGETRVRDRFVISAPVAGRLQRIELEPGDPVIRGKTVLARILPAEAPLLDTRTRAELSGGVEAAQAAVGQARAERERASATLDRARSTLRRLEQLADAGAIARDDLEAAQTAVTTAVEALRGAEFTVTRTEYELQISRARLQAPSAGGRPITIIAPVDGVVLKRRHESETVVPSGEPLIEIGDPGRIEIVADLLSTDAVSVSSGAAVLIEQWGGGHSLNGRVRRIEPSGFTKVSALGVEEQRVNVLIDVDEARELGDAYRVEVRVVTWRADDVLKVPVGSLFRRGTDWAVFVISDGRARLQSVELGHRNDNEGEILKGLEAGQTLVLHPPDTLTDGMQVKVRGT